MSLDPVTEIISHFSGFFGLAVEQARMRTQYEEFQAQKEQAEDQSELLNINIKVNAKYSFQDFIPTVEYTPTFEYVYPLYVNSYVDYSPLSANVFFDVNYPYPFDQALPFFGSGSLEQQYIFPEPPPPGSLALVLKQTNELQDGDFIDTTGMFSDYQINFDSKFELEYLIEQAGLVTPITSLDPPESEESIIGLIKQVAAEIQSYNNNYEAGEGINASFNDEATAGSYVNGAITNDAPFLSDVMPEPFQSGNEAQDQAEGSNQVQGSGLFDNQSSVDVIAGENLLINQVSVTSSWSTSAVVAVDGDVHNVNVISQVNVWNNHDTISSLLSNGSVTLTATQAYNIASITVTANPGIMNNENANSEELVFPVAWNITRLDANLVFLNSVEQVNFITDSDVHVLTSSTDETMIVTGDNVSSNSLSMLDIMAGYDLIVVAGSYYNANIIIQTNILLDNDAINTLGSPNSNGFSSVNITTDGNLLWNQAGIHSIGNTSFEIMPEEFQLLADALASGSDSISAAVLGNPLFSGLTGLSVLYIEGDIYDLQYISQTNILGDSDEINLLVSEMSQQVNTEWEVSSGENALINVAEVVDVGPDTTVLVGGEHYSDAMIHQAELAPEIPMDQNNDGLVSEAVVFLVDDMQDGDQGNSEVAPEHIGQSTPDADLMQTMLS